MPPVGSYRLPWLGEVQGWEAQAALWYLALSTRTYLLCRLALIALQLVQHGQALGPGHGARGWRVRPRAKRKREGWHSMMAGAARGASREQPARRVPISFDVTTELIVRRVVRVARYTRRSQCYAPACVRPRHLPSEPAQPAMHEFRRSMRGCPPANETRLARARVNAHTRSLSRHRPKQTRVAGLSATSIARQHPLPLRPHRRTCSSSSGVWSAPGSSVCMPCIQRRSTGLRTHRLGTLSHPRGSEF